MGSRAIFLVVCLFCGSLAVSVKQHRGVGRSAEELTPVDVQHVGTLDEAAAPNAASLLEVNAGVSASAKVTATAEAKLEVLRSVFPEAVVISGQHKNAQALAVEATGPPPLTPNWGIVSDSFGKSRLNLDFDKPTMVNAIAIINGQGCYFGTSTFRFYGSNTPGDFSNQQYPGITSNMYLLGTYAPDKWANPTSKCDVASASQFNPTEQILTLSDANVGKIRKASGFRFYIFLFDDTYGSVDPQFGKYFAVKHITVQGPRRVPDAFPFYKFVFTQTRSQAAARTSGLQSNGVGGPITTAQTPVQLAEARMWTDLRPVDPVRELTTNPNGFWTTNFEPKRATDNLVETSWRDVNMQGQPSELWLVFNSLTSFTFYEFVTGADEPAMDPSSWILYGSMDQHAWTMLDVRDRFEMPLARKTSQKFEINFQNYPTPVYVGATGTLLTSENAAYSYAPSTEPGIPGQSVGNMFKDGNGKALLDGVITSDDRPVTGVVVGWPMSLTIPAGGPAGPQVVFSFSRNVGVRQALLRIVIGYLTFKDFAIGPPNAVLLETSADDTATWTVATRWPMRATGQRVRDTLEISLPRVAVSHLRLTFLMGGFTWSDGSAANKIALDEISIFSGRDPCEPRPCSNNAACASTRDQFSCLCPDGYQGSTCTQPIDRCSTFPMPCLNGGTCVFETPPKLFSCRCPPGYEGTNCEDQLNPCAIRPCGVNGTCQVIGLVDFKCQCNPGFVGQRCVSQTEVEGQIPVAKLDDLFNLLDVRVDKMEEAGDKLLAAKIKMEKQRSQILQQGRQLYRNTLGLEQSPIVDPNNPPGAFETIAASLYGAGGGANGGFNFPSPGTDSLLGGDESYYPEIADPIYGTDPNGLGPGVGSLVNPYESVANPESLISLYIKKPAQYPKGLVKESTDAIGLAAALADRAELGTPATDVVHDSNREFPLQTPGVAFAAGPLFDHQYSGGPQFVPGVGGPAATTQASETNPVPSLDSMIRNLEDQLKVPNTLVYHNTNANVGLGSLLETDAIVQALREGTPSSRSLLSVDSADSVEGDDEVEIPQLTPAEKTLMFKLRQAQLAKDKHDLAEQNLRALEHKLAKLQARMEHEMPDGAVVGLGQDDQYITALLALNSQVKTGAGAAQHEKAQAQATVADPEDAMTVEQLNGMDVAANRPFPLSGRQRFLDEYKQAFPGLDADIQPTAKVAKRQSIGLAPVSTPSSLIQAKSSLPGASASSPSSSSPSSPSSADPEAAQRLVLQRTLQALLQTRQRVVEDQRERQMKKDLDSLPARDQDTVIRTELMKIFQGLGTSPQQALAEKDSEAHESESESLPGLGAIDVLAAATDATDPRTDNNIADLVSIAENLQSQMPKQPKKELTADEQAAAAALKRTKELNYLENELNLFDPDHQMEKKANEI